MRGVRPPPAAARLPVRSSAVPTGNLPTLLETLQTPEEKAAGESTGTGGVAIVALLHIVGLFLLLLAGLLSVDRKAFRTDTLLVNGDVPTQLVILTFTNMLLHVGFSILSALDAAYYLGTRMFCSGGAFALAIASASLSAGMTVVAAFQLTEAPFWLWFASTVCTSLLIGLQLAGMLALLVLNNSPLLRAIRLSV